MRIATGMVDEDRCSIWGKLDILEPPAVGDEPLCATCGQLLRRIRDRLSADLGINPNSLKLGDELTRNGVDSLDFVELIMELEEDLRIQIPDGEAEHCVTLRDLIRLIRIYRDGET